MWISCNLIGEVLPGDGCALAGGTACAVGLIGRRDRLTTDEGRNTLTYVNIPTLLLGYYTVIKSAFYIPSW